MRAATARSEPRFTHPLPIPYSWAMRPSAALQEPSEAYSLFREAHKAIDDGDYRCAVQLMKLALDAEAGL